MQYTDGWKRSWPVASVFTPPLLTTPAAAASGDATTTSTSKAPTETKTTRNSHGPWFFNPYPKTTTLIQKLFSLPSSLLPPFPSLTLPRFMSTTGASPYSLLPSAASSIAKSFLGDELISSYGKDSKVNLLSNCLQLFRCPHTPVIYAFFPAGDNLEKVGFLVISIKDCNFQVKSNNGCPFFVENGLGNRHRILKLLINSVNNIADFCDFSTDYAVVGHMLAFSDYCVCWYSLKVHTSLDVRSNSCPIVELVGFRRFQSSSVAHACWSPHVVEQSVVLLENGDLFLFDLECSSKNKKLEGERLRFSWDDVGYVGKNLDSYGGGWLSCEFGWHPRILVVAHSSAVFSVDMRSKGNCAVSCLLKMEMFSVRKNDRIIALSQSGPDDRCYFVVSSKYMLLLFDMRNPMKPLLQWEHHLDNLNYISVLSLSELRSRSKEVAYKLASESGYCILLGSFLDCEYTIFCYGVDNSKGVAFSKKQGVCNTKIPGVRNFCAWGLPSDISLSGRECHCATCLVRDKSSKEALPRWIDRRQKKDRVMGFGIVDSDLSSQLLDMDNYGGFYLIRLMFSGKLEVQRYRAGWEINHAHEESLDDSENNLLNDFGEAKYDLRKRHHFLALNNLKEYLSRNSASDAVDSSSCLHDNGHAVSLGDDTDNLSDGVEKMMYTPSSKAISPDHNMSGVNLMRKRSIPEKKGDNTPLMAERSHEPPSGVKQGVIGEIFDEGCPIELKFDDPAIDFGEKEMKMYKWLKAQDLKFQKALK